MNAHSQGLGARIKDQLIQRTLERRLRQQPGLTQKSQSDVGDASGSRIPPAWRRFDQHPGYLQLRILHEGGQQLGVANPFFRAHDGRVGATTRIDGREYLNYGSYNYLAMAGDPAVTEAAKRAIDRYGTTVSASRLVSGERPVHRELERALADLHGVDDAVVFVSGHATNVSTIGCLFGPRDLILHDEWIHNSTLQGIQLAGAHRIAFAHNDWQSLDELLRRQRWQYERVLVVLEGLYSMDGDYPDLPRFVEMRERHGVLLMIDEAHSIGVLGATGRGIREHFGLSGADVDIWMGTLSKSLAGCGGYIAGENALVEQLKFRAAGFLYSVGMPPPMAAASLTALHLMLREPGRVHTLQARGAYFLRRAKELGIDTGLSRGLAVIPALTGGSLRAARVSERLFAQGINVQPILYPAVAEKSARLRFFLTCEHTEAHIDVTLRCLSEALVHL